MSNDATDSVRTYSIPQAGAMAELGRSASYKAARRGEMPLIKLGRNRRVPAKLWDKILDGEVEQPVPVPRPVGRPRKRREEDRPAA